MGELVEASSRFRPDGPRCRFCPAPATVVHFPHVDHRRRGPWPESIWTCAEHDRRGVNQAAHVGHPRSAR